MTVKELIAALERYDGATRVAVEHPNREWWVDIEEAILRFDADADPDGEFIITPAWP